MLCQTLKKYFISGLYLLVKKYFIVLIWSQLRLQNEIMQKTKTETQQHQTKLKRKTIHVLPCITHIHSSKCFQKLISSTNNSSTNLRSIRQTTHQNMQKAMRIFQQRVINWLFLIFVVIFNNPITAHNLKFTSTL